MTRHNLDVHISWLLSNKVTLSTTVNARVQVATQQEDLEIFGIPAGDLEAFEEEDLDLASSPVREPQNQFARPQPLRPPPRPSNAHAQVHSTPILPGSTVMSRHESVGKGRAPSVMTQHQLATPASTTTSTAATSSSSLANNYNQMLASRNGGKTAFT
jgi:bloom syndrome protein